MTGIGGLVFARQPGWMSPWQRLRAWYRRFIFFRRGKPRRFLLLCFRRTGSNWVAGMLFNHPEILMHNELFNENGVHSYYKQQILADQWDYEGRDCDPAGFVRYIFDELFRKVDKFYANPEQCKAVGFKSFPNHYLQHAVPLATHAQEYRRLLRDPNVKKVVLYRENVPKVYLSSRRSHEQGNYMTRQYADSLVEIDVAEMQRFVWRYEQCYESYRTELSGQVSYRLSYEELCQDPEALRPVLRFLGVASEGSLPPALEETVRQSAGPISASISNYAEVEFAFRHTPLAEFLPKPAAASQTARASTEQASTPRSHRWALLVPVRSGERSAAECEALVCGLRDSLIETLGAGERPRIVFGVDDDDAVYLADDGLLLRRLFSGFAITVEILPAGVFTGAICKIWARLATVAYETLGADFTCLLGDDVVLRTPDWQRIIEREFVGVSRERGLPFGAACVAFEDEAFPGFPTFPVVHRWHYETFGRKLLPYQFVNQGGDPFLFELYKRFGSARFAPARLENTIGGRHDARYMKQRLRFEDDILSAAIAVAQAALGGVRPRACLDVVVPTYRCDVDALRRITRLRASWDAAISFWIILDNPGHPKAGEVLGLQTVAHNYQVNVRSMPRNCGASAARNFGLGHSKADWVVLLDDDVAPGAELLDAYLGGSMRCPGASVLVGSTLMPPPHNWLTHAIVASDIPGAYTIADRTAEPPWGVTANLCVRGRTSRLRFDLRYPKSGGGEDLDYCARARRHGAIIAVPRAKAHHPWWHGGGLGAVGHILGWADGEVLCVGAPALRAHIFLTMPNGVELALLLLPALLGAAAFLGSLRVLAVGAGVLAGILACDLLWHASGIGAHRLREPVSWSLWRRSAVRLLAAVLIVLQEQKRFRAAIQRSPTWLLWRVDWHFGQSAGFVARSQRAHALRSALYLALVVWVAYLESREGATAPARCELQSS